MMDIERDEQLASVYAAMDARTRSFLAKFKDNLDSLFSKELSTVYLEKMEDHLETFYEDVNDELETKRINMAKKVDELLEEARNLKRTLRDTGFNLFMNENNEMSLMDYKDKLDQDLVELRELYEKKRNIIDECLLEQKVVCEELGEEPRELSTDPLATEIQISDFKTYLGDLHREKMHRINEIGSLQQMIEDLCNEMEIPVNDTAKAKITPTLHNIARLKSEVAHLEKQRESIKIECEHLIDKLELLWECLDALTSARTFYRDMAMKYTQESLEQITEEFKRCKKLKQEHIKEVIFKMREKIVHQWNKIYKSESERQQFNEYFESTLYNDDLLKLHEMEYEECKRFYEDNKNIFELFNERNNWFEKKKALDAKQNDRNRYNNRGGQLLREEKERKLMDMKIPKIENEIKALVQEYRQQNDQDFMINGEGIVELMERDWENYRGTKELLKSARKAVATPVRNLAAPKTPMSLRGQMTMKRVASTTNLGLSTGNLAKKRHLEIPTNHASTSTKKINATSLVYRNNIKRNLLSQLENTTKDNGFARPTLKVPSKLPGKSLANLSAGKIVKKYRRSSRNHFSHLSGTDESLLNYDVFESKMKSDEITNSSVVGQEENVYASTKMGSMLRPTYKTPTRINNNTNRTKSPLKPSNFSRLQTKNVVDLV